MKKSHGQILAINEVKLVSCLGGKGFIFTSRASFHAWTVQPAIERRSFICCSNWWTFNGFLLIDL